MGYLEFFNTSLSIIIIIFLSTFNIIYLYFRFFFSKEQTKPGLSIPGFGCPDEVSDRVDKMEKTLNKYNEAFVFLNNSNHFLSNEHRELINNDKDVKKFIEKSRESINFERK